ncbi:Uu.00g052890.m01.CDS01 [Anthostomella pinea]|uniref:Uu.00g052890.m01.CDS01 n=1 Tax=Anthostomella pinea TaxID=933095 RepID=A0AAI8YPD0_9PEZI|nr:Uu.00g052890.m01.CDS01 [Anthostomella pinea]
MSAGHPTTGYPSTYADGDEKVYSQHDIQNEQRHHSKKATGYMPKEDIPDKVNERYKSEPGYAATMHGNEPSRGAKKDAEIQAEEEEIINRKKQKTDSLVGKKPPKVLGVVE